MRSNEEFAYRLLQFRARLRNCLDYRLAGLRTPEARAMSLWSVGLARPELDESAADEFTDLDEFEF